MTSSWYGQGKEEGSQELFVEKHCGPKFKITTDKYTFVEVFVANNYKLDRKINWLKKVPKLHTGGT